jgi:hypothetical protein
VAGNSLDIQRIRIGFPGEENNFCIASRPDLEINQLPVSRYYTILSLGKEALA